MWLRDRLALAAPTAVEFRRAELKEFNGYRRERLEYEGLEGDLIPAFLFTPVDRAPTGGVVVFHQHNGEFHFGKSEVAGEVGDRFQAFGPALARRGVAVLTPDTLSFEDRRVSTRGVEPGYRDWVEHYNTMAYRLLEGDLLMRKCLDDAQRALSVLLDTTALDPTHVGVAGHSYGGYMAMYHAAVDYRCKFVCLSGCVCSFGKRFREETGMLLFETVPGLARDIDTHGILTAIGPRPTFVVSGTDDKYSRDADQVVAKVPGDFIRHLRVDASHPLDEQRFGAIVAWIVAQANDA